MSYGITLEQIKAAPPGTCPERVSYKQLCAKPTKRAVMVVNYSGTPVQHLSEPVDLCGLHASMYEKRVAKRIEREAQRAAFHAREDARLRRVSYASNVAMFLGQKLGVTFEVDRHGNELSITVDAAEALLARLP